MSSVSSSASRACDHGDTDGRVGDGVELEPGLLVGEGHGGQGRAVDRPVGGHDPRPEAVDQRLVGRAAGRHDVAGHLVGVDQHGAPLDQQVGHGRLARADAAGEPDGQHQPAAAGVPARGGRGPTAKRTSVVSSSSSVTNQSSAVMPGGARRCRRARPACRPAGAAACSAHTYHECGMRWRRSKTSRRRSLAALIRRAAKSAFTCGAASTPAEPHVVEVPLEHRPELVRARTGGGGTGSRSRPARSG